jgi:hypothetical protein
VSVFFTIGPRPLPRRRGPRPGNKRNPLIHIAFKFDGTFVAKDWVTEGRVVAPDGGQASQGWRIPPGMTGNQQRDNRDGRADRTQSRAPIKRRRQQQY